MRGEWDSRVGRGSGRGGKTVVLKVRRLQGLGQAGAEARAGA